MPREVVEKFTVYKFSELNPEAQEKALQDEIASRWEDGEYGEKVEDLLKEELEELGLPSDHVLWSDDFDIAFFGRIDLLDFITKGGKETANRLPHTRELNDVSIRIGRGNDFQSSRKSMWIEGNWENVLTGTAKKTFSKFADWFQKELEKISGKLKKSVKKEVEYLESRECLEPLMDVYEYYEDGRLYQEKK